MIAQVVPLVKLKNNLDYFSYSIPSRLEGLAVPGRVVRVNFRNRPILGLIVGLQKIDDGKFRLKDILEIAEEYPLLEKWQIRLIKNVAEHYLVSMSSVVSAALPESPKRNKEVLPADLPLQSETLDKMTPPAKSVIKYRLEKSKIEKIRQLIADTDQGKQILIISPELAFAREIYNALIDLHPLEYSSEPGVVRNWKEWRDVFFGRSRVIIGTRSAVFAPVNKLGLVIIDSEENENHKQSEPNPRYDARTIADFLSDEFSAPAVYFSRCPSINMLHSIAQKHTLYEELDAEFPWPAVKIIDMKNEHHFRNTSPISDYLRQAIESLSPGQKCLIYLNKLGRYSGVICRDCGNENRFGKNEAEHDSLVCQKCKGVNLFFMGQGIEAIADLIRTEFSSQKVVALAADSRERLVSEISAYDIVITTVFGITNLDLTEFSVVCSFSADLIMSSEDFRTNEKNFSAHYELMSKLSDSQEMIIQTRNPEHYIYTSLLNADLKHLYLNEINERRQFNLPPLSRIINLIYKNKSKNTGELEVKKILTRVKNTLAGKYEVRPPLGETFDSGQFIWHIEIKLPISERSLKELDFLRLEPVLIDVDPQSD